MNLFKDVCIFQVPVVQNLMVSDDGRVVLIDFNASRQVKECGCDTTIMGTVGYVAPEQLGLSQTDARTDIYAAGVLCNVMLTGQHPSVAIASGKAAGSFANARR